MAIFAVDDARLTLHISDEFNRPAGVHGLVAYWDVDDVDALVERCKRAGGVPHRGPKTIFTGERLCQLLDPFGNPIGFLQAPGPALATPQSSTHER